MPAEDKKLTWTREDVALSVGANKGAITSRNGLLQARARICGLISDFFEIFIHDFNLKIA